jgi:hypothetical protein
MKFVLSATMNASDLRQVLSLWGESGDSRNPFANMLVSPLFTARGTFRIVKEELKEKRNCDLFRLGWVLCSAGRINFETLYHRLYKCYQDHTWADWYVLPDHVPTSRYARRCSWQG